MRDRNQPPGASHAVGLVTEPSFISHKHIEDWTGTTAPPRCPTSSNLRRSPAPTLEKGAMVHALFQQLWGTIYEGRKPFAGCAGPSTPSPQKVTSPFLEVESQPCQDKVANQPSGTTAVRRTWSPRAEAVRSLRTKAERNDYNNWKLRIGISRPRSTIPHTI